MCVLVSHQVDPSNLPVAGPSEDYVTPDDVQFEQVWDPSLLLPSSEGAAAPPDPGALVDEFKGVVSHDKVGNLPSSRQWEFCFCVPVSGRPMLLLACFHSMRVYSVSPQPAR